MVEDNSRVEELLEALGKLQSGYVEVGILGTEKSELLMIAGVQEYGVDIKVTDKMRGYLHSQGLHLKKDTKYIKVPERSYIRSSYDENKNKIAADMEQYIVDVVELKITADDFFNMLGKHCVSIIQEFMRDLKQPPNHPFTVQQKGSSNPLMDTGRLVGAIDYQIKYG